MSSKLSILKLTKTFGNNHAGEVAGFTLPTAAHILKHNGAELLAEIDPKTERFDLELKKVVKLAPAAK